MIGNVSQVTPDNEKTDNKKRPIQMNQKKVASKNKKVSLPIL